MTPHNLLDQLKKKSLMVDGQRVVPDRAVAALYDISLGRLRSAVKRNPARFPEELVVRQGDTIYFAEMGILMVSSVIRNRRAAEISVGIVRELFSYPDN